MNIVVDTNVIISALIKDSETRRIIVTIDQNLVAPEFILREIKKHTELIQRKSGLNNKEITELLKKLFKYIHLVPDKQFENNLPKAREELEEVDPKDVIFLATALTMEGKIWSDDSDLKEQDLVPTLTTSEVIREFST